MANSFPYVQSAQAISPFGGPVAITLPASIANGDVIVVWYQIGGVSFAPVPTSVTDNQGNVYNQFTVTNNGSANNPELGCLFVTTAALSGTLTITVNGVTSLSNDGQFLVATEYEAPFLFNIFATPVDASGGVSLIFGGQGAGGYTGSLSLNLTTVANHGGAIMGLALINPFSDVTLIITNYDYLHNQNWSSTTSGLNIRQTVHQPIFGGSGAYADIDYPYIGGMLAGQCNNPPNGTVGVPYGPGGSGHFIDASGGTPPYTFSIVAGALPPGLSITASGANAGLISGTPTNPGKFNFTVQITDNVGNIVTIICSISICPPPGSGKANVAYYSRH